MTREEAINLVIKVFDTLEGECNIEYDWSKEHNARDLAIKALEQDSIIDKIRAEIEQNAYPIVHGVNNHEKGMTLNGILQVIDKYKEGE